MADFTELLKINNLLEAASILKLGQNEETLAGTKTLVTTDKVMQKLNPGGASRDVILSAITNDLMFIVHNSGTLAGFNLVVKNPAAATLATLGPGMMGVFHCGTAWKWLDDIGVYYDNVGNAVTVNRIITGIGSAAKPAVAIGEDNSGFFFYPGSHVQLALAGGVTTIILYNNPHGLWVMGPTGGYPQLRRTVASATNPNIIPYASATTTGLGGVADKLSLISGGVQGVEINKESGKIFIRMLGSVDQTSYNKIEDFDEEAAGVQLEAGLRADEWTGGGTNYASANVIYTGVVNGEVSIATTAADDDSAFIMGLPQHEIDKDPIFEVRFKMTDITNGFCGLGLVEGSFVNKTTYDDDICLVGIDSDNAHGFGAARLVLITNDNNAGAIIDDLGVNLVAGTYVKIKVDLTDTEQPRVWVNDTEVAAGSITGTVQAGITMANYAMAQALSAAADTLIVDDIKNWSTR